MIKDGWTIAQARPPNRLNEPADAGGTSLLAEMAS